MAALHAASWRDAHRGVLPDHLRRGNGRRLMAEMAARLRDQGAPGGEAPCLRIWWSDPDRLAGPAGR